LKAFSPHGARCAVSKPQGIHNFRKDGGISPPMPAPKWSKFSDSVTCAKTIVLKSRPQTLTVEFYEPQNARRSKLISLKSIRWGLLNVTN